MYNQDGCIVEDRSHDELQLFLTDGHACLYSQ